MTTLARANDPITSKMAGADVENSPGSNTLQMRLLRQFGKRSMTAEMAALNANLPIYVGYWKRVSELKKKGLIEPRLDRKGNPLMWDTLSGKKAQVLRITQAGRDLLKALKSK